MENPIKMDDLGVPLFPRLPNNYHVSRCLDPQTPTEARPLGGPFTPILTRYDWRVLED